MKVEELLASGFTCTAFFFANELNRRFSVTVEKTIKVYKKETLLLRVMRHNFG